MINAAVFIVIIYIILYMPRRDDIVIPVFFYSGGMKVAKRFVCPAHEERYAGRFSYDPGELLAIALDEQREKGDALLRLPLFPLAEAEALGASVIETPEGAWIREKVFSKPEQLPESCLAGQRIDAAILCAGLAAERHIPVLFELHGLLTVLDGLLPTVQVYKMLRQDHPYLRRLCRSLAVFAGRSGYSGLTVFSFADPLADMMLIGEKNFREHYLPLLNCLLADMRELCPGTLVHLCGKLSQAMLDCGAAEARRIELPHSMSLGEAYLSMLGRDVFRVFGQDCVNCTGIRRQWVTQLEL